METIKARHIQTRFTRALSSYDAHATAQQQICRELLGLLLRFGGADYHRVLEIGCGTGGFTRLLADRCNIREWVLNDLCEGCADKILPFFSGKTPTFLFGDAETLQPQGKFDLIASSSVFQWMNNPKTFLHHLSRLLDTNGTLVFSSFVPGNLHEIYSLTGKGLIYPTLQELTEWLSDDFNIDYAEEEEIRLLFDSPLDVLRHLKATGVTATGNDLWTRTIQQEFCENYTRKFATTNQQIPLTYCPVFIVAHKK